MVGGFIPQGTLLMTWMGYRHSSENFEIARTSLGWNMFQLEYVKGKRSSTLPQILDKVDHSIALLLSLDFLSLNQ